MGCQGRNGVAPLIMAVLRNGCSMIDVKNYVQEIIIGAVAIDNLKNHMTLFKEQEAEIPDISAEV